jgi:hypothetical protein
MPTLLAPTARQTLQFLEAESNWWLRNRRKLHKLSASQAISRLARCRPTNANWESRQTPPATEGDVVNDRLDGWKAVAAHLRKSVRTAQRWERELGLPVHRMQTETGEIVYAFTSEIDNWVRDRERAPRTARSAPEPGVRPDAPALPFQALSGFAHHHAIPHMVPSILVPISPTQRVLPWLAGGGILLAGTLIGWLLARV